MKNSKKLTAFVKAKNEKGFISFFDYVPATIANIFSVVFSLSIVLELKNILNGYVLILLSVFVILFLIQNEVTKVVYIRRMFKGVKSAIIPFVITFLISVTLASIGIFLFVNKTMEIKDNSNIEKVTKVNDINYKYQVKINDLNNNVFEGTKEYESLNKELYYWKHVSAATLIERDNIRERIDKIQNTIQNNRTLFAENKRQNINQLNNLMNNEIRIVEAKYSSNMAKSNKNNFISYIFLALILITEFATIVLNRTIAEKQIKRDEFLNSGLAKKYISICNILTSMYMTAKDNVTDINLVKYSPANYNGSSFVFEWDQLCIIYNQFISVGILDDGYLKKSGNNKEVLTNKILLNEIEAQAKLEQYFELSFKSWS